MLEQLLLAETSGLMVESIEVEEGIIVLVIASDACGAVCPECQHVSQRVHSRYWRRPADLSCVGLRMRLNIEVRRFFCDNPACPRETFAERFSGFLEPFARRTNRLASKQRQVALTTGGEAGAVVLRGLGMPVSPDTLLRLMLCLPEDSPPPPRVIGVDDWAWRKGQRYGTLVVDLERRCPIDLLEDRSADSLVAWLQAHPSVEIISRDRGTEYIDGATRGAPDATQVADRWHLLQNLREALERLLDQHRECLYAAATLPATANPEPPTPMPDTDRTNVSDEGKNIRPTRQEQRRQATRERRVERYQRVMELHRQGVGVLTIVRETGLNRKTIRRYIESEGFPEMAQRRKLRSILDPYLPYVEQRWAAGEHNGTQLYREIQQQGYQGSRSRLAIWVAQRRRATPTSADTAVGVSDVAPQPAKARPWSARYAVWLLVKAPETLSADQQAALAHMLEASPVVRRAYNFGQALIRIVRERISKALDPWLEAVQNYQIPELRRLARSLTQDKAAVHAALVLPWSNGQTEGQINRLKLIKRQMYGRAKFDLLRARVLARPVV